MTATEVRAYLPALPGGTRAGISPELVVNVHDGDRDFYAAVPDRRLGYYVDKASFTSGKGYELALTAVRQAAKEWQGICPECQINFVELEAAPSGPAAKTGFVVRQQDSGGGYVALAFFPHDPPARRVLRVDPIFFNSQYDPVGVFRHELGHVLGYRHEHIRGIPGCGFEDNRWQPLTPYDPHSVMHYFCGGGGSLRFALSEIDAAGHRSFYGRPRSAAMASDKALPSSAAAGGAAVRGRARTDEASASLSGAAPSVGNYFILEGDLKMTEQEVTPISSRDDRGPPAWLIEPVPRNAGLLSAGPAEAEHSSSTDPRSRRRTNTIERPRPSSRPHGVGSVDSGLDFAHVKEQDGQPPRQRQLHRPHGRCRGHPSLRRSFRTTSGPPSSSGPVVLSKRLDPVGVFRHELGHVLVPP